MSFDAETINSVPMLGDDIRAVVDWLIDGARSAPQPQQVLAELSARLVACGIPLWRVAVFVRTLHPNVMGRRFIWRPGAEIEQTVRKRGFAVSPALSIGTGALIAHSERAIRFEKDLSRDVMSQTSRI
jgi:adenylate cyclase